MRDAASAVPPALGRRSGSMPPPGPDVRGLVSSIISTVRHSLVAPAIQRKWVTQWYAAPRQPDRQGSPRQTAFISARSCARGVIPASTRRSSSEGSGTTPTPSPLRSGRPRQRHARAATALLGRDFRARWSRNDAVAYAKGREAVPILRGHRRHSPGLRGMPGAERTGRGGGGSGRRRCGTCCARPRSSPGPGRRPAERATRRLPSARSSRPSPSWRRCGTSCARPTRRASSGCWSSGSICARWHAGPTARRRAADACRGAPVAGGRGGMKKKRRVAGENWEFDGSTITVHIPMTGSATAAAK